VGAAFSAIAQPLEFETPSDWRIVRSPMLLIQQNLWVNMNYVRGLGVTVVAAAPGLEDRALKVGSTLVLRIDGGRILRIFDLPDVWDDGGPIEHHFEAWLPESRHYVVRTPCIHCRVTYLIDARDGRVTNVDVPPVVSPSGRLALLWEQNLMDGPNGPALLDLSASPPLVTAIPAGPACDPRKLTLRSAAKWIDDSQIEFSGPAGVPESKALAEKQFLRIIDGKPEWKC
jgi:hypothetical protein